MTHSFSMPCPKCRRELRIRREWAGQRLLCKHCQHKFYTRADFASAPSLRQTPGEADRPSVPGEELQPSHAETEGLREALAGPPAPARNQPDDALASLMVQAYSPNALNQPAKGVKAAQIVTLARPSAQTFYTLAVFAYAAGDKRTGDLAAAKTLSLTPTGRKTQTKLLLDQAKKPQSAQGGGAQAPAQSATGQ